MPQPTPEIDAFIERIQALSPVPGASLDAALQPSLDEEAELRSLFATDRQNARLNNPHVGLVDIFAAPDAIRVTRSRVVQEKGDLSTQYVMPLSEKNRRQEGTPCMVADLEEFKKNWAIFTEGSLFQLLDWSNVVAAGGSVLACIAPLDEEHKKSKRATRKYYHSNIYPTSDVDLFLWGLDAEKAEAKIKQIYEAVRDSVPWDVTCVRTKHTISIHSQYPYRSVQIVLRLYHSPAEILAGFDIDAPCCAYDGNRVWANPRAVAAMMRQCNTVDVTRRSPSYEARLAKYSERNYEVYLPSLSRDKIDPTIYERSIMKIKGLARLLVLEKLKDDRLRTSFLRERRELRERPKSIYSFTARRRKYKGDLKQGDDSLGLEMNNYDVGSLHIPYGPGWDARRIDKLIYQTDLGMNSTFNPKNKGRRLHRHAAFFGTAEEVFCDCCEHCPQPIDKDEEELQKKEDESYIRGKIQFIEENPGRQSMTGSFNPIDDGEWGDQAYIHPTALLFQSIAKHDRAAIQRLLKDEKAEVDLHRRDHVGRTALHVAILVKAVDIAEDLIDAGARITARLADGRTPLHLAAQYDLPKLINKLVERSKKNQLESESPKTSATEQTQVTSERPSSEDDWSSHDDEDVVNSVTEEEDDEADEGEGDEDEGPKESKEKSESRELKDVVPEDVSDEPDIIDVNICDWDFGFTAICYAVVYGSQLTLEALLTAGADPKLPSAPSTSTSYLSTPFHPLTLTIIRDEEALACAMAEVLIKAGATSTTADPNVRTIFHYLVTSGRTRLVETVLRSDPNVDKVINLPHLQWNNVVFPVSTAVGLRSYGTLAVIIAHGAKLNLQETDITKARENVPESKRRGLLGYRDVENYLQLACQPVEVALAQGDGIAQLIIPLGATVDFGLKVSVEGYFSSRTNSPVKWTIKEWVDFMSNALTEDIFRREAEISTSTKPPAESQPVVDSATTGWKAYLEVYLRQKPSKPDDSTSKTKLQDKENVLEEAKDALAYLSEVSEALSKRNAKIWQEIYPSSEKEEERSVLSNIANPATSSDPEQEWIYAYLSNSRYSYARERVPQHCIPAYDELFEACYAGHNEKIQRLCLPDTNNVEGGGPLNVSVKCLTKPTGYRNQNWGFTPLFAAISGRRWSTAKLILAIAAAQYEPGEDDDKIEFNVNVMDDDSDTDSTLSDASDITIDQEQIKFVDIASRVSQIRSPIHPSKLLDTSVSYFQPSVDGEGSFAEAVPIELAVISKDLETFVHIANLYETLPQPVELPDLIEVILEHDQVQILNEYIRRTGRCIDISGAQDSAKVGPIPVAVNDENKLYLGLNVHGKKRIDLAKKNDPNATDDDSKHVTPLVWKAIKAKAAAIVSYLSSEDPLAAYRHYASSHSDSTAIWFRRLGTDKGGELEKWLPNWLGWSCEGVGESPLSTAILCGDPSMVKLVAKLDPKFFSKCLQTEIKFLGLNSILMAVSSGNTEIVDFLLNNGVSAIQRDAIRGWNIYHHICSENKGDLLKFCLEKLPRDVNEQLLSQKSRRRGNTPLHLAVKRARKTLVSILIDYTQNGLSVQDVDGQTPLHCAVSRSYFGIVDSLLRVTPKEDLVIENGVGITPREILTLSELLQQCHDLETYVSVNHFSGTILQPDETNLIIDRVPVGYFSKVEDELKDLTQIVPEMVDRGTVPDERKLEIKREIKNWATHMFGVLKNAKEREERKEAERKAAKEEELRKKPKTALVDVDLYPCDTADIKKTSDLIKATPGTVSDDNHPRRLIHLLDVQQSVNYTLTKVNPEIADNEDDVSVKNIGIRNRGAKMFSRKRADFGGLEEEEEESRVETFLIFNSFATTPDPY